MLEALLLFKTVLRVYTFLSQIFDYGNTGVEKRSIFYKHLIRLLDFGREREGVDLSKIVLTHHSLRNKGKAKMDLGSGDKPLLDPLTEAGTGEIQDKQKAFLREIIRKVNELFEGELTNQDKLVYVNNVIKGKLLESEVLAEQARNNTKQQFSNSHDLSKALTDAMDAHTTMSTQALNSEQVRKGLVEILLGPAKLYETLRETPPAGNA